MSKLVFAIMLSATGLYSTNAADALVALNAVDGSISLPFIVTNGCLTQPVQSAVTNGGRAVYSFSITEANQYALFVVSESPLESGSVLINIDSEPTEPEMKWHVPFSAGFSTNLLSSAGTAGPHWFQLTSGSHQLIVRGCDANIKIREIRLAGRPAPPSGLRIVTGPQDGAR